ncbi:DUF2934 domain-containing protein [Rhizobium sp. KVB221]|uniref:DUF2934 domain-containing protein n=1 Tax=Rhizobium setariae TaxID=2801340 RepID=A0A936YQU2_9HYPH|nr:DUF2934 domain-containing protein [Rhizobium setariae]MBL0372866.1 DUF2934 domain-containing protein [Rhizobium setariae]
MTRTEEEIRKKAYAIWESEGRPEGQHHRHWLEALRDSERSSVQLAPAIVKAKKPSRAKVTSAAELDVTPATKKSTRARKPPQS